MQSFFITHKKTSLKRVCEVKNYLTNPTFSTDARPIIILNKTLKILIMSQDFKINRLHAVTNYIQLHEYFILIY